MRLCEKNTPEVRKDEPECKGRPTPAEFSYQIIELIGFVQSMEPERTSVTDTDNGSLTTNPACGYDKEVEIR
jgi:hypothetical protein